MDTRRGSVEVLDQKELLNLLRRDAAAAVLIQALHECLDVRVGHVEGFDL